MIFCRLSGQLVETMSHLASELMEEEKISCEAESDLLWLQVEGYAHLQSADSLNTGRCAEGNWAADAVPGLVQAVKWSRFSKFTFSCPNVVNVDIIVRGVAQLEPHFGSSGGRGFESRRSD